MQHPEPGKRHLTYSSWNRSMVLLAQNYAMVYGLVFLGLLLGVIAVSIPRIRRKVITDENR